jgi:membrane fusion protein (multidrug efflux system)
MVTLASRVPGWVTELRVIAGDPAAPGDVLVGNHSRDSALVQAELDARLAGIAAQREQLEARIAMADRSTASQEAAQQARREAARAARPGAEAEKAFAEQEFARSGQLLGTGSGTRQRPDQLRAQLETASWRVLIAQAEIRSAEAQLAIAPAAREELTVLRRRVEALEPQARELRAQRERAALDLADRTLRMPFAGVVDRVFVDPGEYVTPGQRLMMVHDPRADPHRSGRRCRWIPASPRRCRSPTRTPRR